MRKKRLVYCLVISLTIIINIGFTHAVPVPRLYFWNTVQDTYILDRSAEEKIPYRDETYFLHTSVTVGYPYVYMDVKIGNGVILVQDAGAYEVPKVMGEARIRTEYNGIRETLRSDLDNDWTPMKWLSANWGNYRVETLFFSDSSFRMEKGKMSTQLQNKYGEWVDIDIGAYKLKDFTFNDKLNARILYIGQQERGGTNAKFFYELTLPEDKIEGNVEWDGETKYKPSTNYKSIELPEEFKVETAMLTGNSLYLKGNEPVDGLEILVNGQKVHTTNYTSSPLIGSETGYSIDLPPNTINAIVSFRHFGFKCHDDIVLTQGGAWTPPPSPHWNDIQGKPNIPNDIASKSYVDEARSIAQQALTEAQQKITKSQAEELTTNAAKKLASARKLSISDSKGDLEGSSSSFDGSKDVAIPLSIKDSSKQKFISLPEITVIKGKPFTVSITGGDMSNGTINGVSVSKSGDLTVLSGTLNSSTTIQSNNTKVHIRVIDPPNSQDIDISF